MLGPSMRSMVAMVVVVALLSAGCLQGPGTPATTLHFKGTDLAASAVHPFTLTAADNSSFSLEGLRGKVVIVLFIWSYCPDVCPITSALTVRVLQLLGDAYPRDVAAISITLDPYRDTPQTLTAYQQARGLAWPHLSGNRTQLQPIWDDFDLYVELPQLNDTQIAAVRAATEASLAHGGFPEYNESSGTGEHPSDPDDWLNYTVDHTVATFLLDARLQKRVLWSGGQWPPEDVAADVGKLVALGP